MAASMTLTETTWSSVKKIKAAWTSGSDGSVSGTTTEVYNGRILGAITVPGTGGDAPDDNYDIAVNDSDSVDIALGALANRDTANTEFVTEASMAGAAATKLTIAVTNAGDTNKGTLYLYVR